MRNSDCVLVSENSELSRLFDSEDLVKARMFQDYMSGKYYKNPVVCILGYMNLNVEITEWHWLLVSTETRLREMHWNILHNIYPTDVTLFKMVIVYNN